jgi:hypothetical protein
MLLKFGIWVGMGERMSGKEFGENRKFQDGRRAHFRLKMTILPAAHHADHKVGPIVFISIFFNVQMAYLLLHHHGDCRMSPIVSILSEHVVMYDNMPYG